MTTYNQTPTDQDVKRYNVAFQEWSDADKAQLLAETESSKRCKERKTLEAVVHSFQQEAQRTKNEADEARASLQNREIAIQKCDHLVEGARAVRDKAVAFHGEKNLEEKVNQAKLDVMEAKASLAGMQKMCSEYRAVAAAENARVVELERVAVEDLEAWEELRDSSEYIAACDACSAASVVAEEKMAAVSVAESNLREAEGVFRAALASGDKKMAPNERVADVLRAVYIKMRQENMEREIELSREPVILPKCKGIEFLSSGSSFGVAMLLAERKREENEKAGNKGRGAAARSRARGATGDTAPRIGFKSWSGGESGLRVFKMFSPLAPTDDLLR
eukprot:jgi/Undpi1/1579/HiC_scaffold_11.g04969.m1